MPKNAENAREQDGEKFGENNASKAIMENVVAILFSNAR